MAPMMRAAPAKLNLYLHILGKRADGYHLLESGVVFTALADQLAVAPATELTLTVDGEFAQPAGAGDDNLVLKAARALQHAAAVTHGAALQLTKHIPVGAGLGGGSADAAATLVALNQLWALGFTPEQLRALALPLGADVAMCIDPKPVIARGIGEALAPWPVALPTLQAVLVHPRTPLLTADVYRALTRTDMPATIFPPLPEKNTRAFIDALAGMRNDLEPAACAVSPVVSEVLAALKALTPLPLLVRMTGSGACCFALYETQEASEAAAASLRQAKPHWWVGSTSLQGA